MKILLMYEPSADHLQALEAAGQQKVSFCSARSEREAWQLIEDVTAVMGNRFFLQSLPNARDLCWMQSNSVGVDLILEARDQLNGVVLTCAKGVYDSEMSDHALALLLALIRQLHLIRDEQRSRKWIRRNLDCLSGKRATILGWGGVGQGIAARLQAFGVEVGAVRRSHEGSPRLADDGITFFGPSNWRKRLHQSDFLILALPRTKETEGLVGRKELSMLPSDAFVINVGRGETLDQEALLALLREEALMGAALDVFEREPLLEDDPIWEEGRLIISPHVARSSEVTPFKWEPLFVENLRRFVAEEPLLNVVDMDLGY